MNKKRGFKLKTFQKFLGIWIFSILFLLFVISYVSATSSDSSSISEWSMSSRDLNHTGYYPGSVNMHNFGLLWTYTIGSNVDISSPAIVGDILYIGAEDNKLYALNASTGSQIWNYTTGNYVHTSPAVAGGIVYVGSDDGKLYAVNATNGNSIWNYTTGSYALISPSVAGGIVYVGSDDGKLHAVNATNGTVIWTYTTGSDTRYSSPAVAGGIVYVGADDKKVYALNASTGSHIWNYTTGGYFYKTSPAIANDIVYVGSADKKLYALNASTGSHIWNYTTGGYFYKTSPAIANDIVYVGSSDRKLHAVNATNGTVIWTYTTGGETRWSSPAVTANDMVFIGSRDQHLYTLNASTGSYIWRYAVGAASSPAIANGVVYIGDDTNHKVYAFSSLETPTVTLVSPVDSSSYSIDDSITFNCSAEDDDMLNNITLYIWDSSNGVYYLNNTSVTGWSNNTNWTVASITKDSYKWNCYACDNESRCSFANSNRTFTTQVLSASLDKSSDSWLGEIVIYGNLTRLTNFTGFEVNATITPPTTSAEIITLYDDGVSPDATLNDGIYSGKYNISHSDGAARKDTGTYNVVVSASNESANLKNDTISFTTFQVLRWFENTATNTYTDFNVTWNGTDWHHDITNIRLQGTATHTDVIVKFPILPSSINVTNLNVSEVTPGSLNSFELRDNIIVLNVNTINGALDFNFEFDAKSDLAATYADKYQSANIGERKGYNGYIIWNQFTRKNIIPDGHASKGAIVALLDNENGTSHSVDCMERTAVNVDDACHAGGAGYEYNIYWDGNWTDWLYSANTTAIVFKMSSPDDTSLWYSANTTEINRTVTFYSQEKYQKYEFVIRNKDTSAHNLPLVWGREHWIYPSRQVNDRGITPNNSTDWGAEYRFSADDLDDNWIAAYDDSSYYGTALLFLSNSNKPTYAYFLNTPPLASSSCEYPINYTGESSPDMAGLFFEKDFESVPAGEMRNFTFYHWGGHGDNRTNFISLIEAAANEIEIETNTAPTVNLTSLNYTTLQEDNYNDTINLSNYVTDPEDSANLINWSCSSNETNVTAVENNVTKILNLTALNNWYGYANITCTTYDTGGSTGTDSFVLNVTSVNDAPEVLDIQYNTTELNRTQIAAIRCLVNDIETANSSLSVNIIYKRQGDASWQDDLTETWDPTNNWWDAPLVTTTTDDWLGTTDFNCTVNDTESTASKEELDQITVYNNNVTIVLSSLNNMLMNEDSNNNTINMSDYVSDVEDDDNLINYTCSDNETDFTIEVSNTTKLLNLTALNNWYGYTNITCTAYDTDSGTNTDSFIVNVTSVNDNLIATLISPSNSTGDNDGNLTFYYNVSDVDSNIANCSLIINSILNQTNTSITKDTTQNLTLNDLAVGSYNWSVNCTDSFNNIGASETRTFSVAITTEFSGDTTDLSQVNISNITNLIIDQPSYGKINFSEPINLSFGGDLNTYINISNNRIEINSTALPALNKAARLKLYNLTYSNPRVLKDGSICSDCTEVSYSEGTFVFDVTSFSVYSSEETPTTTPDTPSGGSGGGGGIPAANTTTTNSTESNLQEGYSKQLYNNLEMKFKSNGESHSLKLNSFNSTAKTANITVSSNPQTKILSVGEEWKVNLNNDSYYDFLIRLDNVTFNWANIFIQEINENTPSGNEEVQQDTTQTQEPETTAHEGECFGGIDCWYYIGVGVIVLILAGGSLIYFLVKKKKRY